MRMLGFKARIKLVRKPVYKDDVWGQWVIIDE
jgi:hypothetical protein